MSEIASGTALVKAAGTGAPVRTQPHRVSYPDAPTGPLVGRA